MARSRPEKTLADYLAIAVTPLLIMLLVGSLVFFLNELVPGQYSSRIRWILFWFVIGMVLVARIAIESGRAQASLFTLGLGAATSLAIFKFVPDVPWVPIVCLAIIWWCADKLTWDCSLIDDDEDASGEGLLQVAGVAEEPELKDRSEDNVPASTDSTANGPSDDQQTDHELKVPFWKRVLFNTSERDGKPHAPGLWVVYFSLAALPLFGFGQALIRRENVASRDFAFRCLLVYVGAGLGLLMLTSFLGLRRYLRQRKLQMPGKMAATWVGMGAAIAAGILVTALLLPRPDSEYDLTAMIDSASEKLQQASDRAFLDDAGGEGESDTQGPAHQDAESGQANDPNQQGQPGGDQPGQQTAQNAEDGQDGQAPGGEQDGQGQGEGEQSDQDAQNQTAQGNQSGDSSEDGQQQNQNGRDRQNNQQQTAQNNADGGENQDEQPGDGDERNQNNADRQVAQNEEGEQDEPDSTESQSDSSVSQSSSSFLSNLTEMIGTLFKWIVYAIIAAIVLYLVIRNWHAVANFLLTLWREFLNLFGRRPEPEQQPETAVKEEPARQRPFSSFRNPFRSGAAAQHSPSELVRYTFDALQAWAAERDCGRSPDQTPMEFGQQLRTRRRNDVGPDAQELSELYAGVAYGGLRAKDDSFPLLERLWSRMLSS